MTAKLLGQIGMKALEDREISCETASRFGIYTGKREEETGAVIPSQTGNLIVFPYMERGVDVAEKYRTLPLSDKKFSQRPNPRRTFWNSDILDDPTLAAGHQALIITEGEIDALTAVDCGFPFTVSVPDGAPPVPKGKSPTDLDPLDEDAERTGKFEYVWNNRDRLKAVKSFIIAVDNDAPGQHLGAELVRRLSAARCLFVTYPDGCKDLNDVRMRLGPEAVAAVLNNAKPYPVHGLYRLSEFPELPAVQTYSTGWWTLDRHLQPFLGELMFVLGIPGHGKSVFIANLLVNLSEQYGWRAVLFSPEEPTSPHMRDKLRRIRNKGQILELDRNSITAVDEWINDRFLFIDVDPLGQSDQEVYLDWILDRAIDAVLRDGIKVLVIDPWNEIEHARNKGESQTEYIGRAIRAINRFRRTYGVMVIVLIHPTKEVGREGKARPPTPYDADGCYTDDTEVLTRRGWLHHAQITLSDDVACFDPDTSAVEWHQPQRIIRREHDGPMVQFKGYGFDLLVTPEHRMLLKAAWPEPIGGDGTNGRPRRFEKGKWHFIEAKQMPGGVFKLPLAGTPVAGADPTNVVIADVSYPAAAFWRAVGWWVAEGSVARTGLVWSQAEGESAQAMASTLAEAGITCTMGWQQPSGSGTKVCGRWYVGNRTAPGLASWFVANCGDGAASKRVPDAMFDLSPALKREFLDGYIAGDGCKRRNSHAAVTISRQLRDDLQRLSVEIGVPTSFYERRPVGNEHSTSWQIAFGRIERREVAARRSRNVAEIPYRGLVWCLTVPTGAYFVRRNGKVAVSGNSAHWFNKADHFLIIHRPDETVNKACVRVAKVKFEGTGEKGTVHMSFDRDSSRFGILDGNGPQSATEPL